MSLVRMDPDVQRGFRLAPEMFGASALENVTTLFLEDRTTLEQFEEDVEAILRVWDLDDPLDAL